MKKIMVAVLAVIAAVVLFFGVTFAIEYVGKSEGGEEVTVTIPQGATGRDMARILKDNGVIRYELSFLLKIKTSPYAEQLNYGEFNLHKHMGVGKVIEILKNTTFKKEGIKLTVPEGYSIEKIAVLCEETGLVTAEEFLDEIENGKFDYDFIKDIPDNEDVKYKLQGYIFPSTHIFDEDSPTACTTSVIEPFSISASAIVKGMRSPCSPTRTITKCPGRRERAIIGASTTSFTTFSEKCSFSSILFIFG